MRNRGFSLVETLVASAILSGAVLTVAAISTNALTMARLNRQYEVAATVADRQLRMIDYIGIDDFIEMGQTEGVVADYEPSYRWEVAYEYQEIDSLYLVSITVSWVEMNRPRELVVQTMFDGLSTYALAEEAQGGQSGAQ